MSEVLKGGIDYSLADSLQEVVFETAQRDFNLDIHQEVAVEQIIESLRSGNKTGYVEMATGSGKTTLEALIAAAAVKSGKRVLMLAPTLSIADQLSGREQSRPTGLARFTDLHQSAAVGHHYGRQRSGPDDAVVITTYAGFLFASQTGELGEFDVILADECHRSLGAKTAEAMRSTFPQAVKIGFSATPDYAVDREASEVFDTKLFDFSLIDAIESGRTAPLRTLVYETNTRLKVDENSADFTSNELAPLIDNLERNGTAYRLAKDFVKEGRQGIIACIAGSRNAHARVMAKLLSEQGVAAADVGSHMENTENIKRLQAYRDGDIKVLTFTRALEEGWDDEQASFCINMAPTTSPVRTKQLMGRVLRPNRDGRESIYIDFIDEKEGIAKQQYTALHALGLETIDFNRVLGRQEGSAETSLPALSPFPSISRELLARLEMSQGKLIDDINSVRKNKPDPVTLYWEGILAKEGLPSELPYNDIPSPAMLRRIEKSREVFSKEYGREPHTASELMIYMDALGPESMRTLGEYGLRVALSSVEVEIESIPSEDEASEPFTHAATAELIEKTHEMVRDATLGERLTEVVELRFGLADGQLRTLESVGREIGLDRERVRQLEAKAFHILRRPERHMFAKSLLLDNEEISGFGGDEAAALYRAEKPLNVGGRETIEDRITDLVDSMPHGTDRREQALSACLDAIEFLLPDVEPTIYLRAKLSVRHQHASTHNLGRLNIIQEAQLYADDIMRRRIAGQKRMRKVAPGWSR